MTLIGAVSFTTVTRLHKNLSI